MIDHDFSSEYIVQEDLTKAARKVSDAKKHESMSLATTLFFFRRSENPAQLNWNILHKFVHLRMYHTVSYTVLDTSGFDYLSEYCAVTLNVLATHNTATQQRRYR